MEGRDENKEKNKTLYVCLLRIALLYIILLFELLLFFYYSVSNIIGTILLSCTILQIFTMCRCVVDQCLAPSSIILFLVAVVLHIHLKI